MYSTLVNKKLHKCPYCENTCYGIQCKSCHLKMLETHQATCIDCNELFHAVRKDGSKRRRCLNCQTKYNEKYISICPYCLTSFHSSLDDGRFFDKCFSCYKKSLHQCSLCEKLTKIEYDLCKVCYLGDKKMKYNKNYKNIKEENYVNELELFKCGVNNCLNISSKRICPKCSNVLSPVILNNV